MADEPASHGPGRTRFVAAAGRDMLDREARERGSVLSSAKTCLLLFKDPIVAENTRRCEFRLRDLMKPRAASIALHSHARRR